MEGQKRRIISSDKTIFAKYRKNDIKIFNYTSEI